MRRPAEVVGMKPDRALPIGQQWIGHCGERARKRYLRQRLARIKKLVRRDEHARIAFERLAKETGEVPDEFGTAHGTWVNIALNALERADATRTPWATMVELILDGFEQMEVEDG